MKNTYPNKIEIFGILPTYTKVYVSHSANVDYDIVGKSIWLVNTDDNTSRRVILTGSNDLLKNYITLDSLSSNSNYSIQSGFYDAMIDSELLEAKIGFQLGELLSFKTKEEPSIASISIAATTADVGVSLPELTFNISGEYDSLEIEYKPTSSTEWLSFISGTNLTRRLQPGTYNFRVKGVYSVQDGIIYDESTWYIYPEPLVVDYIQIPPEQASNLTYKIAKINDGVERYDLRLDWEWEQGTGAAIREFIVYYVPTTEYALSGWDVATRVNTGASKYIIINSFPYNIGYTIKVVARSWGSEEYAYSDSTIITVKINETSTIDNSFTNLSKVEVTYSGIFAYLDDNGDKQQTFKLDASNGALLIGTPDSTTGVVPFSFDPVNKKLNISGSTITDSIYSANFILTNLTGTPPVLRSQEKLSYSDNNQGIWMGYDTDSQFKFSVGDSSKYIKWTGSDLYISGEVTIGTINGDVELSEALQGFLSVFIYKSSATQPATPSGTAYPPEGWYSSPPSKVSNEYIWTCNGLINPLTTELQTGEIWSPPVQWSGSDGFTPLVSVFGDNQNSSSAGYTGHRLELNGGVVGFTQSKGYTLYIVNQSSQEVTFAQSYDVASIGTSSLVSKINSIAENNLIILSSTVGTMCDTELRECLKTVGSGSEQTWVYGNVSHVFVGCKNLGYGQGYEAISASASSDGVVSVSAYFSATSIVSNGVVGSRGPGFYSQSITGFTGTFDETSANAFFIQNFGQSQVIYDVITQFNTTSVSIAATRMWNGDSWTTPALAIHGDMIATGTITASKIVASDAFFQQAGINVIYDNAAAISSSPETNYIMKIDLANGYIHIR